ncbi:hypothetical protein TNCV_2854721 [Trichonephila clavipes]|nr:hypothetical protein TNCV_2854721 [Trichonephila clavipes]
MEDELAFQLYLAKYQRDNLSAFIPFMMHFRIIVKGLLAAEIIDLQTETKKRIVELLTKVLPHHQLLDVPCFTLFTCFEPADEYSDYLEKEAARGKGSFIQALWTLHAKSKLYHLT